jgi:signal transduction histidine kinase
VLGVALVMPSGRWNFLAVCESFPWYASGQCSALKQFICVILDCVQHSREGVGRLGGFQPKRIMAWTVAVLLAVAALLVRLPLNPLMDGKAPFVTFLLATMASAALSGFWPGIATAIGGALLSRFAVPQTNLLAYLVSAICVCAVCEILIRARDRARDAEQRLRETQRQLQVQAEELRRSNRDLEEFAFVASHDMQESLRAVKIYTELLLRKVNRQDSAELTQYAGYVSGGVERIQRLVRDLLDFSRVIHNETESIVVDANAAVAEAMKVSEDAIRQSEALIVVDPLPMVRAGEAHVVQVFQNLISNSLKYRKENEAPRVYINATVENGNATFRVQDNGIGFEQEYAAKVFKLFTRLHGKQYQGSGLGLAICHRVVERYGGKIWAESKPGEGSTFFFTLPMASGAEPNYVVRYEKRLSGASR